MWVLNRRRNQRENGSRYKGNLCKTKIFQVRLITKQSKLKLYRTVIRPMVTYTSETWVLKEALIQKLFWEKILRRRFGPPKEKRFKTNEVLDKPIKHKNIINYIKDQWLSWFGHIQRMPENRTVKKIFNWKPLTKRSQEDATTDGSITSNRTSAKWR